MSPVLLSALLTLACTGGTLPTDSADTATGDTTPVQPPDPRYDDFIAALQADFEDNHAFGTSVAIHQDGRPLFTWTVGHRDADGTEPLSPDTLLQIGSTTKMFTATALLQQVQAGRLALDQTLGQALPELTFAHDPDWQDEMSLHHLISMQSGFVDAVDWLGATGPEELADWHLDQFPSTYWVMAPPGSFFNYSNPGFTYAGYVTERVDPGGRYWEDLVVEDVFRPLGMDRTYVQLSDAEADGDWAESYGYNDLATAGIGTVDMSTLTDPTSQRPAGSSTWSTPTQLIEMARFLMDGDTAVLDGDHHPLLTADHVATEFDGLYADGGYGRSYGYGVMLNTGFIDHDNGWVETPVWCHGGATVSFSSDLCVLPEHGFAISILSSGFGSSHARALATAMGTLIDGLPASVPYASPTVDPARLEELVGTYDENWQVGRMIFTLDDDGELTVEMPVLDDFSVPYSRDLIPYASDLWFVEIQGAYYDLSFVGPGGEPAGFVRNRSFVGIRSADDGGDTQAGPDGPPALPPGLAVLPSRLPRLD